MAGISRVTITGPRTATPVETIIGGQLIEGRDGAAVAGVGASGALVGVAAAASKRVVGVAILDCQTPAAAAAAAVPTTANNRPLLLAAVLPVVCTYAYSGDEVPVTYAAAAAYGAKLVAAANGQVTPAGATPDATTIVGICTNPGGVAAGATVGLMRIA